MIFGFIIMSWLVFQDTSRLPLPFMDERACEAAVEKIKPTIAICVNTQNAAK